MSVYSGPEASELFMRYLAAIAGESDRGAVLVAASLLDEGLERLMKIRLVAVDNKDDPLFDRGFAPLRSFAAKIELAFRLGLITRDTRRMLDLFRELRNDFAHGTAPVAFQEQPVKDRLRAVFNRSAPIHRAIVKTFEEVIQTESDNDLTLEQFLETERGQRAIFDTFFASNAMALHRTSIEVERLDELKPSEPQP